MPARVPLRLDHDDLLLLAAAMHERQRAREEEEDAVHDRQCPARLEHRTGLPQANIVSPKVRAIQQLEAARGVAGGAEGAAVVGADAAEGVDTADEGADDAEVDEGDEVRVVLRAVVGEECAGGPDDGEDYDDEEDEDSVGGEGVGADVEVDEVGEHAQRGDLCGVMLVKVGDKVLGWGEETYECGNLGEAPEGEEEAEKHGW